MAPAKKAPAKKVAKKTTNGLTAPVVDLAGKEVGTTDLPEELFKVMGSPRLLAQYVRVYLANQRQGTHQVQGRSDVTGSTKKIWRQKGTGRARHSSRKANLFVGGGVTFGPQSRSHNLRMSKKQRQKALLSSLTRKADDNGIHVLKGAAELSGKTKQMTDALAQMKLDLKKTLFVYAPDQADTFKKVMGNVKSAHTSQSRLMNAFNVLKAENIVFTQEALDDFISFRKADKSN